jgi:hypothetical protein
VGELKWISWWYILPSIKENNMPKIAQCNSCHFYSHSLYFVCAIHPSGIEEKSCLDYRRSSDYQEEEQWCPEGYYWYDGELCKQPTPRSPEEQLWMIDNHPFFTGVCPQCGYRFDKQNPPRGHWDCPSCGWIDEEIV